MPRWVEGMALLVILVLMSGGCMTQREVVGGYKRDVEPGKEITVQGWMRFVEFEGGFWRIVGNEGRSFDPVFVPLQFRENDLKIRARLLPLTDLSYTRPWRTPVQIVDIRRAD